MESKHDQYLELFKKYADRISGDVSAVCAEEISEKQFQDIQMRLSSDIKRDTVIGMLLGPGTSDEFGTQGLLLTDDILYYYIDETLIKLWYLSIKRVYASEAEKEEDCKFILHIVTDDFTKGDGEPFELCLYHHRPFNESLICEFLTELIGIERKAARQGLQNKLEEYCKLSDLEYQLAYQIENKNNELLITIYQKLLRLNEKRYKSSSISKTEYQRDKESTEKAIDEIKSRTISKEEFEEELDAHRVKYFNNKKLKFVRSVEDVEESHFVLTKFQGLTITQLVDEFNRMCDALATLEELGLACAASAHEMKLSAEVSQKELRISCMEMFLVYETFKTYILKTYGDLFFSGVVFFSFYSFQTIYDDWRDAVMKLEEK